MRRTSRSPRTCSASTRACTGTPRAAGARRPPGSRGSSGGRAARGGTHRPYEFPAQGFKGSVVGGRPRPHGHVRRLLEPRQHIAPPDFPQSSAQPVAPDRRLPQPRYDHGQPRTADRGRPSEQIEVIRSSALPLCDDLAQVRGASDAGRPRQPLGRQRPWCLDPVRTVSRLRPFLRRRASVSRPHRVFMRVRNPCLLMRFRFRGR